MLGRTLFFLFLTVILLLAVLLGVIWVLEKGPSPTVTEIFCRSMRETSAIRWIPIFSLQTRKSTPLKARAQNPGNTGGKHLLSSCIAQGGQTEEEGQDLELIEISDGTIKGKLLIGPGPLPGDPGYVG